MNNHYRIGVVGVSIGQVYTHIQTHTHTIFIHIYIFLNLHHYRASVNDNVNYYGYAFVEAFQALENGSNTLNLYAF